MKITVGNFTFRETTNGENLWYEVYEGDIRYISNCLTLETCLRDIQYDSSYLARLVEHYSRPRLMIIDENYYLVDSRKILEYCDEIVSRNIDAIYDSLNLDEPKEPELKPEQTKSYDLKVFIGREWDSYTKKKAKYERELKIETLLRSEDIYRSLELVKKLGLKVRVSNIMSDYDGYLKRYEQLC